MPTGLDELLRRAARDLPLRAALLERRAAAAAEAGIALTPDEEALLTAVPVDQLELLLRGFPGEAATKPATPPYVMPPAGIRPELAERGIRPGLPTGRAPRRGALRILLVLCALLLAGLLAWWLAG